MKKTLLAAALLAGFTGVAQAETSVTLYGIIDTGLGYQNIKDKGGVSANKFGMLTGVQSGSRWGMRVREDLTDDLRAVVTAESGFNSGNGTSSQNSRLFGRQLTIGLAGDHWGQLDFGRQTNIASKFFGSIDPFTESYGIGSMGTVFSSANTTRYDNMVMYQTPNFSGFQAGVGYAFNIDDRNERETNFKSSDNQRAITAGLRYDNGPLNVAAAYDQIKRAGNWDTLVGVDSDGDPIHLVPQNGIGDKIQAWLLGGAYDFEVLRVSAAYGQTKGGWIQGTQLAGLFTSGIAPNLEQGLNNTAGVVGGIMPTNFYSDGFKTQQWMLGLSAPIGAATNVFGSWQRANVKSGSLYGPAQIAQAGNLIGDSGSSNMNVYSLGATYDLSKRTNLYALGAYTNNYGFVDGLKSTLVGVGLRHRF